MCLNYMTKVFAWLDDSLLYFVAKEIVQAELMFNSRARAVHEDDFQYNSASCS